MTYNLASLCILRKDSPQNFECRQKLVKIALYCETQNSWRCLRYRHSYNEIQSVRPRARDSLSVKERSLIQTCPYDVIGQSLLTQMSTLCPHGAQLFIQRVNCTYRLFISYRGYLCKKPTSPSLANTWTPDPWL